MTEQESALRERVWRWMWVAYMNMRYHELYAGRYLWGEKALNIMTIISVILGFSIGGLYAIGNPMPTWINPLSYILLSSSVITAILFLLDKLELHWSEKAAIHKNYSDLFKEMYHVFARLFRNIDNDNPPSMDILDYLIDIVNTKGYEIRNKKLRDKAEKEIGGEAKRFIH